MRSIFPEFFPLAPADLDRIWAVGLIVVDTNVLLRLYRFPEATAVELIGTLERFGNRIWIPHQVAWEYNRRRSAKIKEAEKHYQSLVAEFTKAASTVRAKLSETQDYGIHPNVDLSDHISALMSEIETRVKAITEKYEATPAAAHFDDLHDRISGIYDGRVGHEPTGAEIEALCKEGESRFEKSTPPGFKDVEEKRRRGASDQEAFGDFIIWRQIIEEARRRDLPVIFITEDAKDDWWLREDGKTIGALPTLRKEFLKDTGQQVHFYRLKSFIEESNRRRETRVSEASVQVLAEFAAKAEKEEQLVSKRAAEELERELLRAKHIDRRRRNHWDRTPRFRLGSPDDPSERALAIEELTYAERKWEQAMIQWRSIANTFEKRRAELGTSHTDDELLAMMRHEMSVAASNVHDAEQKMLAVRRLLAEEGFRLDEVP